jgi:DNA-binding NtrC family response regulator
MVRGEDRDVHVGRIVPRIRPHLRPVDRLGLYSPGCLLALLPESDRAHAEAVAHALAGREKPALTVGVAIYPEDAGSAEELVSAVRQAARSGGGPARAREESEKVVAASPEMKTVFQMVDRVARSPIPVLLLGETGVGKEVVARAIHEGGPRKGKPLKSINCAAIPHTLIESVLFGHEKGAFTGAERAQKGVFEQAHGGTVLLDEVGELPPPAQAALLRVLETKRLSRIGADQELEVDVRVVAATHRDLEAMCNSGAFRWDLLYRLNTMPIVIPPLRERREEIEPLAELFLREARKAAGSGVRAPRSIDEAARVALESYAWPGNVRELKNVIERAVVVAEGDAIRFEDLPQRVRGSDLPPESQRTGDRSIDEDADYKERVRRYEIELIVQALTKAGGNQTEAARILKMPLRTLVHKIQTYGIKKRFEAR